MTHALEVRILGADRATQASIQPDDVQADLPIPVGVTLASKRPTNLKVVGDPGLEPVTFCV